MGLKDFIIGSVIVVLFSLSLLTFAGKLAVNNNAQDNILNDPSLSNFNESLGTYLGDIEDDAQTQREAIEGQEAQGGSADEGFGLTAIVGAVFTFFSTIVGGMNLLLSLLFNVVGIPDLVLNLILGLVIIAVIIYAWRTIKVGGT